MASEWFYTVNGQQSQAAVSDAQLKQMATAGQIQPSDLVWKDGMANWVPASSIKGLFSSRPSAEEFTSAEPAPARKGPRKKASDLPPDEDDGGSPSDEGGILALHPLLVFLLSFCTLGIFGLVYVYLVCSAYAAHATREIDAAGRPLGRLRHPLAVLILSQLTLGLYFVYWVYRTMADCAAYTGRKDVNARRELALMLILPFYAVYVTAFRLPDMIRAAQARAGQPESGSLSVAPFFVVPCLWPALPFIAMAHQDALNQVWVSSP